MTRLPLKISTDELVAVMAEITGGIRTGDTLEGSVEFHATEDVDVWEVMAAYRTGNTYGQGGMVMIGIDAEPEGDPVHVPVQTGTDAKVVPEDNW